MATLRELVTVWGFDIDAKPLERLEKRIESTKETIKHILEAGAEAAASLFEMARETAKAGDEAVKMSQRVGVGVEKLQELKYAAQLSDVEFEELGLGLKFLSKNLFEASKGSESARNSFRMLGLNIYDSHGKLKSADQVLAEVADRFKAMPDGVRKTALSIELFGRAGTKMIPFLNHGSADMVRLGQEARRLGVVLSDSAARQGEEFNDTLKRMMSQLAGLRNFVGVRLIPVITDLMNKMMAWIQANRQLVQQKIQEFVKALTQLVVGLWKTIVALTPVVVNLIKFVGGLENAFKLLAAVMAVILGFKLTMTFVAMFQAVSEGIKWVKELTLAFTGLDLAMWEITLIAAAIGAALYLLYLIFDDVFVYFKGGDSVLGRFIDFFRKGSDTMFAIREGLLFAFGPLGMAFAVMGAIARFVPGKYVKGNNGTSIPAGEDWSASAGHQSARLDSKFSGDWTSSSGVAGRRQEKSVSIVQHNTLKTTINATGDPDAIGKKVAEHQGRMLREVHNDLKPMQAGVR